MEDRGGTDDAAASAPPAFTDPMTGASPPSVFRLLSSTGDPVVSVDDETGRCVARTALAHDRVDEVMVFLPRGNTVHAFLMVAEVASRAIGVLSDPLIAPVLSFVLDRTIAEGRVGLRSPTAPRYICAVPKSVSADADLNCNRDGAGGWESFSLQARTGATVHQSARALIAAIQAFCDGPATAAGFSSWMDGQSPEIVKACGLAILRLLDRDDIARLAVRCLNEPGFLERLVPDGSSDVWLTTNLPELRRFNRERSGPAKIFLDKSWDPLGRDFGWNRVTSVGEVVHSLARESVEPRRDICIMTGARNEGVYFLEWLAHHRAIGVEHFFVYSNDNDDGSDVLLERLADLGLITWVSNEIGQGVDLQTRGYTHCLSYLQQPLDFRWTVLVDLDEFIMLNPERHASLPDFLRLQSSRGGQAVAMNWLMYTSSGHARWDGRPLMERFTHCEPRDNEAVKTAFITRLHTSSWPHNPVAGFRCHPVYLNATGKLHHWLGATNHAHHGTPNFKDAWIAHYFFKSLDEYIWKQSRGFDARKELKFDVAKMMGYLKGFDPASSVENLTAMPHLGPMKAELERLRSLPGLAEAEAASRRTFTERVAGMKAGIIRAVEDFPNLDHQARGRMLELLGAPSPVG
jgi:hypothetical protein